MNSTFFRSTARLILIAFLWQALQPTAQLLALTGGPTQPEFSTFEPVSSANMVNPLTGQLTYNLPVVNIPGPNGGGYALSLSYHSGVSPEEEASWVGYGWTLNPGSITRVKRGFPDEYNGEPVRYWNKSEPNITASIGAGVTGEIFSQTVIDAANVTLRYNNQKGFGFVTGMGASLKGLVSMFLPDTGKTSSFTPALSLNDLMTWGGTKQEGQGELQASKWPQLALKGIGIYQKAAQIGQAYLQHHYAAQIPSGHSHPYKGISINYEGSFHGPLGLIPAGQKAQISGHYSKQANIAYIDPKAYGYMYSGNAGDADVMDYYTERSEAFNKRDRFLGIPISNADQFNVTGEGIGGGFRLYNKTVGHFHPNQTTSETSMSVQEVSFKGGLHVGKGFGLGAGVTSYSVKPWFGGATDWTFTKPGETPDTLREADEPFFFRMNNDLGGSVIYSPNDDPVRATVGLNLSSAALSALNGYDPQGNVQAGGRRSGRSTQIAYSTVAQMKGVRRSGIYRPDLMLLEDADFPAYQYLSQLPDDAIGEFGLTNPSGSRYNYGLPVIALEESQLNYGLSAIPHDDPTSHGHVNAFAPKPDHAPVLVGEETSAPYVSEYLLTSIASGDYVDRTHDGYSDDDFGGWVRFNYRPSTHHVNDHMSYYKWRVPYQGLDYNPNKLSTMKDDMGSVSMGKKGLFYVSSIETKTHVALFYTNGSNIHPKKSIVAATGSPFNRGWHRFNGSGQVRNDGYPALGNERVASNGNRNAQDDAIDPTTIDNEPGEDPAANPMRRLEKIELWSKGDGGVLTEKIQTVHFEYDYSLCRGLPNSHQPEGETTRQGKLTLKRVYFEHAGVVNIRIAPYVFGYDYRQETDYAGLPADLKTKYEPILSHAEELSDAEENPSYNPSLVGRWGYYREDASGFRARNLIPWENQAPDKDAFDPAAWNLKWVRLPSGGEIHVQYEQNDYGYVQDQPAMVMAQLARYEEYEDNEDPALVIDLEATFGSSFTTAMRDSLVKAMEELFLQKQEKIYFKVLHSLDGDQAAEFDQSESIDLVDLNLKKERLEYITGYAAVEAIVPGTGEISIKLKDEGDHATVGDLVRDFIKNERGRANGTSGLDLSASPLGTVTALFDMVSFIKDLPAMFVDSYDDENEIDSERSWARIPISTSTRVMRAKLGGGVRVKRLLMYDQGGLYNAGETNTVEGHLFGTEYLYETADGFTSGVAANEPTEGREENALVKPLDKRQDQGWLNKVLAGKDKEKFEGPLGETLLPGAAVVYSRVVAKSIHDGKTNAGFTIHEHYTARDYPSRVVYDKDLVNPKHVTDIRVPSRIPRFLWTPWGTLYSADNEALQGYSFVQNGMHGQPKKVATYGGDYDDKPSEWVESSMQEYDYFAPGAKIPVATEYSTEPTISYTDLGKEMEVVMEGSEFTDIAFDAHGHIDVGLSIPVIPFLPVPIVSGTGHLNYSYNRLRTHVTTKLVRYPVVVRKVTARQDGIESFTENIAFNPLSGEPIIVKTSDGYTNLALQYSNGTGTAPHDRSYHSFSYPAANAYQEMGQKGSSEGRVVRSDPHYLTIDKLHAMGQHYLALQSQAPAATCDARELFTPGDLIRVFAAVVNTADPEESFEWRMGEYHVESIHGNRVILQPYSTGTPFIAFDPALVPTGWTSAGITVEIVRSGKTNQVNVPRAGISTYRPDF